jgi:hypothetical protein
MSDTLDLAVASKRSTHEGYTSAEVSDRLDEVGKLIDRTKTLYEQYFMGIQKTAPMQLHRDCERKIRELTQLHIRNTALRFRFATITQKFGSYNTYWRRIMRQIEQGKYIRDVARVSRKAKRQGKDVPDEILASMPRRMREKILRDRKKLEKRQAKKSAAGKPAEIHSKPPPRPAPNSPHKIDDSLLGDFDLDTMFSSITDDAVKAVEGVEKRSAAASADTVPSSSQRGSKPPPVPRAKPKPKARPAARKPAARPAKPPAAPPPGMNEKQTKDLYKRYVQAQKLVGASTDKLSYQKLVRTLNKQAPRIMKQHKAKGVDFNVVIKGDKVVLKAKPKK